MNEVYYPVVMMGFVLQNGSCSLGTACNMGHLDVVKALLEAGANIYQADKVSIRTPTVYDIIALHICLTKRHIQLGMVCEGYGG